MLADYRPESSDCIVLGVTLFIFPTCFGGRGHLFPETDQRWLVPEAGLAESKVKGSGVRVLNLYPGSGCCQL